MSGTNLLSQQEVIKASFKSLPKNARRRLIYLTLLGVCTNLFDLVGVGLVGVLGAITITGFGSGAVGNKVQFVIDSLHLSSFTFQTQVGIIGLLAAILLSGRSISSLFLSRYSMFFLARVSSEMSVSLISRLLNSNLAQIQMKSPQETSFSVTYGVNSIALSIIGNLSIAVTDFSLLVVLTAALIFVNPVLAISSLLLFTVIGGVVFNFTHTRAKRIGDLNSDLLIQSDELMLEILTTYREIFVKNRRSFYVRKISEIRSKLAVSSAEMQFMPQLSKYVIELALIIGALAVSAFQFVSTDAVHAISTLSIFLAAGARLAPAAIRMQQSAILIRINTGYAKPTIELIEKLKNSAVTLNDERIQQNSEFTPHLIVNNLNYKFPDGEHRVISNMNFEIAPGEKIAIAGPSGSGKSTLVDLLLGLRNPDAGSIQISNLSPIEALITHPGSIGYVPQNVIAVEGSVKHNLSLGFEEPEFSDEDYWQALRSAGLFEYVDSLPGKLDAVIGHSGTNLSGGQKQRIGIARSLITKPKLLFLDESTSALDSDTESAILEELFNLDNAMTVILVTHRIASILRANRVLYIVDGSITTDGTPNSFGM